ncbi:Amphotericin B resistance protein [Komagataella phaffii CBS 7435]|uniref:Amphotericin B resistance protein n=1 Tax=Komagataella phaffii (strain ATCC 76273 / CBS 7435 / CECT 11047 / NRRL Y-11430 / Wegner 21-1) TaxID=981350 RepID=F2QPF7_KOMPC|nr:Plasma Membrane Proteolipid [Komagataella phaffii CBS 7435]CCA37285.1 Amphotericin B resistance protein [Komagataella phaffii CBS 7435]
MALTCTDPIKAIFAIILPPLGVFLEVGLEPTRLPGYSCPTEEKLSDLNAAARALPHPSRALALGPWPRPFYN